MGKQCFSRGENCFSEGKNSISGEKTASVEIKQVLSGGINNSSVEV